MNFRISSRDWFPNLLAFVFGIGIAWFLEWETGDLIWSLWLSSLVVGYLTVFATITGGTKVVLTLSNNRELSTKNRYLIRLGGLVLALFFLGFFSIHFGAFHAIHAGFLNRLFPLDGVPSDIFFDSFFSPISLWMAAKQHVLPIYGVFVISVIIAEWQHLLQPIVRSYQACRNISTSDKTAEQNFSELSTRGGGRKAAKESFERPYINVMKTHFLILFFGATSALGITSKWLFVIAYFVYFFPWKIFKRSSESDQGPSSLR